jgi:hypothetical protein
LHLGSPKKWRLLSAKSFGGAKRFADVSPTGQSERAKVLMAAHALQKVNKTNSPPVPNRSQTISKPFPRYLRSPFEITSRIVPNRSQTFSKPFPQYLRSLFEITSRIVPNQFATISKLFPNQSQVMPWSITTTAEWRAYNRLEERPSWWPEFSKARRNSHENIYKPRAN